MKYEYKTEMLEVGEQNVLVFRLPQEIKLVETFLFSDVPSRAGSGEWVLEAIDRVLDGRSEAEEITGNVCTLEIGREFTRVSDSLADDSETCVIETSELKELILIWLKEKERSNA
jgi:hypothetical protein